MKNLKHQNNLLKKTFKFRLVILLALLICIIVELTLFLKSGEQLTAIKSNSNDIYAQEVLRKCKNATYRNSCYDREIPKLMDKISMRDAFDVARIVIENDKEYSHCHVLGHYLSGRETKKDPSKWKDVVAQCPANICNNGCLHGPLLTRFNSEFLTDTQIDDIKPDLNDVCEARGNWYPSSDETLMCYHGLGHLNMYITNADVNKSLLLCEEEGVKEDGRNYYQTCVQGVFMQIYQPLEPEDKALIKDLVQSKDTLDSFCNQFSGEAWGACRRESWPLFEGELYQSKGVNVFCAYSKDPTERKKCFSTIMSSMTVKLLLDKKNINGFKEYCQGFDLDQVENCYSDAVKRLVQISPSNLKLALQVCDLSAMSYDCFSELSLFGRQIFTNDQNGLSNYCSRLPKDVQDKCL